MLNQFHLEMAVAGLLISILIWRWTAHDYQGFVVNQLRLLLTVVLTGGIPVPMHDGYVLFWIMAVSEPALINWAGFIWTIMLWWFCYSIVFYASREVFRELSMRRG